MGCGCIEAKAVPHKQASGIQMRTGPLLRKRDSNHKYDVIFSKRPLGITLTASKNSIDGYITSIEKSCPIKNAAKWIKLNSKIIYVNGKLVENCALTKILAHLRNGTLPLRLTLIPPRGLQDDEVPDLVAGAYKRMQTSPGLPLFEKSSDGNPKLFCGVSCTSKQSSLNYSDSSTLWEGPGIPKMGVGLIKRDRQWNYDVFFPSRPFYITLTSSKENIDGYVTAISKMCPLENAEEKLTLNSKVIYVNGSCVEGCEVAVIAKQMKHAKLPLRLTLVHPKGLGYNEFPDLKPGPTVLMKDIT